jgi:hypothetical protein
MDKKDIIIFGIVISFVAFRLYQRYVKKAGDNSAGDKKISKDDDYEPYSKK